MNYSNYIRMSAVQLDEEIAKQKTKIKSINETISLLKKLKIAAEVSEKEQNVKTEKLKTEQSVKTEAQHSEKPKVEVGQHSKPQNNQSIQSQQQKTVSGGMLNGFSNKVHR